LQKIVHFFKNTEILLEYQTINKYFDINIKLDSYTDLDLNEINFQDILFTLRINVYKDIAKNNIP
jgi:hypothetical protein